MTQSIRVMLSSKKRRGLKVNEQIAVQDNAVSLEFCNAVVDMMGKGSAATVGTGQTSSTIRRSNVTFLHYMMDNWAVFNPVIDLVNSVNNQYFGFTLDGPESMQITKYDSVNQGHYQPHKDSGDAHVDPSGKQRKLSLVIQLSSPESYKGGDLVFPDSPNYSPDLVKAQGTAIVFPSYLLHGVTPVTEGVRHSLVAWFLGPPFK